MDDELRSFGLEGCFEGDRGSFDRSGESSLEADALNGERCNVSNRDVDALAEVRGIDAEARPEADAVIEEARGMVVEFLGLASFLGSSASRPGGRVDRMPLARSTGSTPWSRKEQIICLSSDEMSR